MPGASGPGVYDGSVHIGTWNDAVDIHDLGGLTCVTGDLYINGSNLSDLSLLSHLQAVGSLAIVGPIAVLMSLLFYFVLKRFGLVAFMVTLAVQAIFAAFPMTFQTSAWYAGYGYAALALVGATALYGFRTSLGGRPLVGGGGMDD